jgi:multiple sugar transport system permease protein
MENSVENLGIMDIIKNFFKKKEKNSKHALEKQKRRIIIWFLVGPLVLLTLFIYYPAIYQFILSFFDWDGFSKEKTFVGLYQYKDVFTDRSTLMTLQNNFAYFVVMIMQTILALYLAIVLDGNIRGKNFFKSVIFLPYILNGIAVAFMFAYFYNYDSSPINQFLRMFGLEGIKFLKGSYTDNFALAFIGMWRYTGFNMIIFLGALQSIPKELYEAAEIDGAGYFQLIRYITIPNIKTIVNVILLLGINGSLQAYYEPFAITKGGPAGRTNTFITSTLEIAFNFRNIGKAAALSFVLLTIIFTIIIIQRKLFGEEN